MRAAWLALVLLTAPLAGCLTGADDTEPGDPPGSPPEGGDGGEGDTGPGSGQGQGGGRQARSVPTPSLAPGLAWRYETSGLYSTGGERTIVVARASVDGYLFAGGSPADLVEEVHVDRPWLGRQTLELNPTAAGDSDGEGDGDARVQLFDFPLTDGKTWTSTDGTVTATRTTLETPLGELAGFEMTLEGAGTERTWTFAPGVGYLVSYTATRADGTTTLALSLADVATQANATWFERLGRVQVEGLPAGNGQLAVPGNASTVAISAAAAGGGAVTVLAPLMAQQPPFTFQAEDAERWTYARRAPAEGDWRVTTTQPPDGFAFASLTAVNWTQLTVGYG